MFYILIMVTKPPGKAIVWTKFQPCSRRNACIRKQSLKSFKTLKLRGRTQTQQVCNGQQDPVLRMCPLISACVGAFRFSLQARCGNGRPVAGRTRSISFFHQLRTTERKCTECVFCLFVFCQSCCPGIYTEETDRLLHGTDSTPPQAEISSCKLHLTGPPHHSSQIYAAVHDAKTTLRRSHPYPFLPLNLYSAKLRMQMHSFLPSVHSSSSGLPARVAS